MATQMTIEAIRLACKIFENYQSLKKIKKDLRELAPTSQSKNSKCDSLKRLHKLLRNIDRNPKKSTEIDEIPSKLVQYSTEVLSIPCVQAYQMQNFQVMLNC